MTSQVVINDVEPRTQAIAFAGQITFNTNWTADAATDINVYRRTSEQDADDQTQLVSQSDYNVEFVGTYETVRITFLVACTADDIVTITRATPSDRENLYTNTNFTPSMLNQDFGILTMVDQQNQMYDQDFCPHYNLSATYTNTADTAIDLILPILGENQFWAKNGDNTAIIAVDISDSGGDAPKDGPYVTYKADAGLPDAFDLGLLSSGILGIAVSGAIATPYSTLTPYLTAVKDVNGHTVLQFDPVSSSVNYWKMNGNTTSNPPALLVDGTDPAIGMVFQTKTTGAFVFNSTGTANQLVFNTGTGYQHATNFAFLDVASNRTVTFPDASGTVSLQTTGSWTPIDTSGASLSLAVALGQYTIIGNLVFAYASITYPVTVNGSNAAIGGLPVTVLNALPANQGVLSYHNGATAGKAVAVAGTTNFAFYNSVGATVTNAQMSSTVSQVLLIYPIS